ncbi:MAG: hypothetical protein C0446_01615 [Chitinophaga sp.]|nr:hypothetical protein [Chitinophaga sp.]PJE48089.1 MAG: hypothetical protein CUR34_01015 [Sediminibacterium sp.] [Sediminibacterium sp. FEMGT703S]
MLVGFNYYGVSPGCGGNSKKNIPFVYFLMGNTHISFWYIFFTFLYFVSPEGEKLPRKWGGSFVPTRLTCFI